MKAIADTLEISRSNLIDRAGKRAPQRDRYRKNDDLRLLPLIRAIVDDRPTYGYRRVTALLNRRFRNEGQAPVNHKRIYRIMRSSGLLLQPYTGLRINRAHDGIVMTLRSNTRWCSDGLEISCWNGEIVRVAFVMDTCDREIIAWTASTGGFSGEMIRDILLIAVERRFGAYRASHRVEFLSDNGSCYTAAETIDFSLSLGLMPRFTPVRSPESNGMSESFVKSFKRDYVRCNPRSNAEEVLARLESWFEDYNCIRPHRGLRMLSPREFIQANISLAACPA